MSHPAQMIPPKMEFEIEIRMFSMLLLMHLTIDGTKYAVKAKDISSIALGENLDDGKTSSEFALF